MRQRERARKRETARKRMFANETRQEREREGACAREREWGTARVQVHVRQICVWTGGTDREQ